MTKSIKIFFKNFDEVKLEKFDKWELKEGCFVLYDEEDVRIYPIDTIDEILIGKWAFDEYNVGKNISLYKGE